MSSKGIFTALSGAIAQSQRLDTIANNIANANTTAFKKDQQTFYEYLTANEKMQNVIAVPRVPASIESFYDMQGGDRGYVDSSGTFTDFTQGQLRPTSSPLDMALEGKGFFEVLTPGGVKLTRNGQFKIDGSGSLVTQDGYPVLKEGTQPPEQRRITLSGRNPTVSYAGDIYDNGNLVGRVSVVDVGNIDGLRKVGNSLYGFKDNYPAQTAPVADTKVQQGFLETSNVNIVDEMTKLISATRTFEANQKSMKAFDQMDDKLVNVVPKL